MRSFIAALRSLTLPFGGTGERIELDGVNGEIRIYDASNNLLITINGEDGFTVYDATEFPRVQMGSPFSGAYSAVQMLSNHPQHENQRSVFSLDSFGSRNRIVIAPGSVLDGGSMEWTIVSNSYNNISVPLLQAVCLTLDTGSGRPIIDLTGAAAPTEAQQPHTVVYDLFYGTPLTYGSPPTKVRSYPRGLVAKGEQTADVTLSTTAGTFTQIVESDSFPVTAGRVYRVIFSGGNHFVTGGSGFATSDHWEIKFQRSNAGAAYGDIAGLTKICRIARCYVAIATRYLIPPHIAYYRPAVDSADITVRLVATKAIGASTVTTSFEANSGNSPFNIEVEDVGTD